MVDRRGRGPVGGRGGAKRGDRQRLDAVVPSEPLRGELAEQLTEALQRVPETAGRELTFTALSGGITNRNFLITVAGETDRYVIRLAGNDTFLLGISREVEHAATVAAAGVGVGPEVMAFIRPEGYLVTRFIVGQPVSERRASATPPPWPASPTRSAASMAARPSPASSSRCGSCEAYHALATARGVPRPSRLGSGP